MIINKSATLQKYGIRDIANSSVYIYGNYLANGAAVHLNISSNRLLMSTLVHAV